MPSTELRQSVLTTARSVVVKLGTQVLTDSAGRLDRDYLFTMADQIALLHQRGVRVTVVSSGAIGAGMAVLDLDKRPTDVAQQQAVAAVGQRHLMTLWHDAFDRHDLRVGQLLLTRDDFDDRLRYLNIRNCVGHLHEIGGIPIANENDTVAIDELTFGDNDMLAALMCHALSADALILLSVVDGLLDSQKNRIDRIDDITAATSHTRTQRSALGTGGMASKLSAIERVTSAGEIAVIAHGRHPNVLTDLLAGQSGIGTVFVPSQRKLDSRRRWIGLTKRTAGSITIDTGAAAALRERGTSLLAIGITACDGSFERGQVVRINDATGTEIARGLTNYTTAELQLIMGQHSNQFQTILGQPAFAEVVHRDNLLVI